MKVTWTTSGFIHRTLNGETTICGHRFSGKPIDLRDEYRVVHGTLHKKRKRHCRTCFDSKESFKDKWLEDCLT